MEEIKSDKYEQNSDFKSSLKRIGNFIKEARISRNLTVSELASNLKIGDHQLQAIEEGREDLLPEKVFIKAMVRRISEKLKIDTEFIMNEFATQRKEVKIEEIVEEVSKKPKKNNLQNGHFSFSFAIFIFVSGIFGFLASSFIFNIFSESFNNQDIKKEIIKKN